MADEPEYTRDELAARCWEEAELGYLMHTGMRERELREYGTTPNPERHGQLGAWEMWHSTTISPFVKEVGRQWGKTHFCLGVSCECAIKVMKARREGKRSIVVNGVNLGDRPGRILYAATTASAVDQFIHPAMQFFRDEALRVAPELAPEYNRGKWVFPDETYILPRGCEDRAKAARLRGPYADMAVIDEAGHIAILEYVMRSIIGPQLLTTGGRLLMPSSPPDTPAHPFCTIADEARARGVYYRRTCWDAPHQTDEAIVRYRDEICGGPASADWRREGLAERLPDPTLVVVPEFDEARATAEVVRPSHFDSYTVVDTGFDNMTWVLFAYFHFPLAKIVVEADMFFQHESSATIIPAIKQRELELWAPAELPAIDADAEDRWARMNSKEQEEFGRKGARDAALRASKWRPSFRYVDASKFLKADLAITHGFSASPLQKDEIRAQVNAFRSSIQMAEVLFHPRCGATLAQCKNAVWKNAARKEFADSGTFGHFDGLAAAIYLGRHVDRQRNPFPWITEIAREFDQWLSPSVPKHGPPRRSSETLAEKLTGAVSVIRGRRRRRRWDAR